MTQVLVPLATGCEELEAVTVIDLLRRAGIEVVVAGLTEGPIRASRGVVLLPDTTLELALQQSYDMIVLPGGLPGTTHLANDSRIIATLQQMAKQNQWIAAICAAPSVLAKAGLLNDRPATSFPGALDAFPKVRQQPEAVVVDGRIITSRGPGTAMDFALTLIEHLAGHAKRQEVEAGLQR